MTQRRHRVPVVSHEAEPYWEAVADDRIVVPQCTECQYVNWFPRGLCRRCAGRDFVWLEASGQATIYTFTVVERASASPYPLPYVLALVDLDEGPRLLTHILTDDPDLVAIGRRVRLRVVELDGTFKLPMFELEEQQ